MVTLDDIRQEVFPSTTEILAGANGCGRSIGSVMVLKPRPPALEVPRGDDLVLLSTRTLAALDPELGLAHVVRSLARDAAALAVQGTVPADAIQAAGTEAFPLLRLPDLESIPALERAIVDRLAAGRRSWFEQRHALLRDLTALAVQDRGLDVIASRLARLSGRAIVYQDEVGAVLTAEVPPLPARYHAAVHEFLQSAAVPNPSTSHAPTRLPGGLARLSAPIMVGDGMAGIVSVVGPEAVLTADDRFVADAAATAGAVVVSRERAVRETVHRIQGDLVTDLLSGGGDQNELERRARRMGYDLDGTWIAVALQPAGGQARAGLIDALQRRLAHMESGDGPRGLPAVDGDLLTVFCPLPRVPEPATSKRVAERLMRDLRDLATPAPLRAGVSLPYAGLGGFAQASAQARRALDLGRMLRAEAITYFGALGVHRILLAVPEPEELRTFYRDTLGPLLQYDRERGGELLRTLEVFLSARTAAEVAEHLALHRNTLAYRLRRIRDIGGFDLDDPQTRFALYLALRAGEVLRAQGMLE